MSAEQAGDGRPRTRRQRSATDSLLSIVLVLESLLMFFLALLVFALDVLGPVPAFVGGGALFLLFVITSRLVRFRVGLGLGFALQLTLIATGVFVPAMYVIGLGFVGLWIYCLITGQRLDRRNGRRLDGTMG